MAIHRNDCRNRLRPGMGLFGWLTTVCFCLAGCQLPDGQNRGGLRNLLQDGSAEEAAIRQAAIEDTSFPTAAQPIPKP